MRRLNLALKPQKWLYSQILDGALRQWGRYVITPFALGLLGLSIVFSIATNLNNPWTSIRLAPSFALARGYPLYSLPDQPPWVMVGYGPFYPLAYLPCIFAKDPVTAVSAATILAYAYILIPVGLLSQLFCRRFVISPNGARVSWVPIFLFFGLLTSLVPSLTYITTSVHVDAPGLGLLLMGCYFVLRAEEASQRLSGRLTALAGVFAGLSASCKFTLLGGLLALVLFVLWSFDWKRAAGLALSAVLTICMVYAWIIVRDGFPAVALNFQVLGRFPWAKHYVWNATKTDPSFGWSLAADTSRLASEKILTLLSLIRDYVRDYGILMLATLAASTRLPARQAAHNKTLPASQLVWLFLFVALVGIPASIASVAKCGGGDNGRAIFTLPLTLAAIFALWATVRRANLSASLAACAALTGAILIVAPNVPGKLKGVNFGRSVMEESYATVKAHPSECYFPYDPLAHLLAGDRFRPNMDVIYSYALGECPVNKVAFAASMPQGIKYVMIPSSMEVWGLTELHRLLPIQIVPTEDLNLEHHRVWGLRGITHSDVQIETTKERFLCNLMNNCETDIKMPNGKRRTGEQ
jgi:hypothetical protein